MVCLQGVLGSSLSRCLRVSPLLESLRLNVSSWVVWVDGQECDGGRKVGGGRMGLVAVTACVCMCECVDWSDGTGQVDLVMK